mgnify:CR=1 FL=1
MIDNIDIKFVSRTISNYFKAKALSTECISNYIYDAKLPTK